MSKDLDFSFFLNVLTYSCCLLWENFLDIIRYFRIVTTMLDALVIGDSKIVLGTSICF